MTYEKTATVNKPLEALSVMKTEMEVRTDVAMILHGYSEEKLQLHSSVIFAIKKGIKRMLSANGNIEHIMLTGHSLGGSLALKALYEINRDPDITLPRYKVSCIAYAPFVQDFNKYVDENKDNIEIHAFKNDRVYNNIFRNMFKKRKSETLFESSQCPYVKNTHLLPCIWKAVISTPDCLLRKADLQHVYGYTDVVGGSKGSWIAFARMLGVVVLSSLLGSLY